MGTIKTDSIQPSLTGNHLSFRTGLDVERLRIQNDGQIIIGASTGITFSGEVNFDRITRFTGATVDVVGNTNIGGKLTVTGGTANVGWFAPIRTTICSFNGGSSVNIAVPGVPGELWYGLLLRNSYQYSPGDSFYTYQITNAAGNILWGGGTSLTIGIYGRTDNYPANPGGWLWSGMIWWWRVS